jgi:sulfur relay (sulfurtransferase) DsrF/TusC family protein
MNETQNENQESVVYIYTNDKGEKVVTPNLEFAHLVAEKYGTNNVYVEKN